jgi:hypothetical protein
MDCCVIKREMKNEREGDGVRACVGLREGKMGTYAAFAHTHRLATPLVVNGTLELEEPRMR